MHRLFASMFFALLLAVSLSAAALAQRDLKEIPDPDPEIERKSFIVADGFEVNLFAADPQLAKPIHMNFDARGRLWVAASEVYPHIKPGQEATDKIVVLEDTQHTGKADKVSVFADGLLIPTGVLPTNDGCYVANSTELIYLQDRDGDGKADTRQIVLSGFGTEDTHHLLHSLRWGHDGTIYMNQSIYIHSHVETPHGVKRLLGGGIWQFRPETLELSVYCKGFVNPWGHHFDHWGQSFATDGAYGEGINYVFPGAVYVSSPDAKRIVAGLNPGSPKHCSLEILSGRHLPPEWQGNMITNDFRAHRVCRFVVTEDNSGYGSRQEVELIKTTHQSFRPIDVKVGPDGAIYIADWYNPIIQHGEVDFRDPRRDHTHGRIWRVTAKGRPLVQAPKIVGATAEELLAAMKLPEEWTRVHAKLELKNLGAEKVLGPLAKYLAELKPQDADYQHQRLEALWVYQSLNIVEPNLLKDLLASPDHHVRAAAMRVASQWRERLPDALALYEAGVADPHPRVRIEAVRALAAVPLPQAAAIATRALDKPMDRFLDFALWQAMRDLESYWLPAVREGRLDFDGDIKHLTFALQAVESANVAQPLLSMLKQNKVPADRVESVLSLIASVGGAKDLGAVLDSLLEAASPLPPAVRASALVSLAELSQRRGIVPAGDLNRLSSLISASEPALRGAALTAAGTWKVASLRPQLASIAIKADEPENVRAAAIAALGLFGGTDCEKALTDLAVSQRPHGERKQAVVALATINVAQAAKHAVNLLAAPPAGDDPTSLVAALMQRKGGAEAFTTALAGQKLSPDTAKLVVRAVQGALQAPPELIAAVRKSAGLEQAGWKMSPEEVQKFVVEVGQADAGRGEAIFRRKEMQCLKCHAIGGAGGKVGPDLVSVGASAPADYLVFSVIEPNQKVKEGFHSKIVVTQEGQSIVGIPVRETDKLIVIRDAEDREITVNKPLESIKDGRSLMPDGLADSLTRAELADLSRFLSELGKVGPYAVGQQRVVRRWQAVVPTAEAYRKLGLTSYDSVAAGDATYVWEPAYSQVSGVLPLGELPWFKAPLQWSPDNDKRVSFVRFELEVTKAGPIKLGLGNVTGLTGFVDGRPQKLEPETTLELAAGLHRITFAIEHWQRKEPLRVELLSATGAQILGGK